MYYTFTLTVAFSFFLFVLGGGGVGGGGGRGLLYCGAVLNCAAQLKVRGNFCYYCVTVDCY